MQQSVLNPPVSVLILHHGEMALHSQQHLHVSRHRVVEKGIGMPLGQLQSLLKKEVICKAMSTTTAESRSLASPTRMAGHTILVENAPFGASGLGRLEKAQLGIVSLTDNTAKIDFRVSVGRDEQLRNICYFKENTVSASDLRRVINLRVIGFCHHFK